MVSPFICHHPNSTRILVCYNIVHLMAFSTFNRFSLCFFFFFQAEDGIRDDLVTGVQTCALPIWSRACFSGELGVELAREDRVAACLQHALDLALRQVDRGARLRALLRGELAEPFQELGERARLAEEARLHLLEVRDAGRRCDRFARCGDDLFEFFHQKKRGSCEPLVCFTSRQAPRFALASSTYFPNAVCSISPP